MRVRSAAGRGAVVAAACTACCAPPIIAALGITAGFAAVAGAFLGLAVAVAVVLAGAGGIVARRRPARGVSAGAPAPARDGAVPVGAPTRRATPS